MAEQTQIINETNELKTHEAEAEEEKTRSARIFCGEAKNCKYINVKRKTKQKKDTQQHQQDNEN